MIDESEQLLDDLLSRWHSWAQSGGDTAGYPATAAGFGQYRSSHQYDSDNGAEDDRADAERMWGVDWAIQRVPQPHRTAIFLNARNLVTGQWVWFSARLPQDIDERARIVMEARVMLMVRLKDGGVV